MSFPQNGGAYSPQGVPPTDPAPQGMAPMVPPTPEKKPLNVLGLIALILAVLATILSLTPIALLGWILFPVALVLGIVGVFQSASSKLLPIIAIIVTIVGAIASIIFALVVLFATLEQASAEVEEYLQTAQSEIEAATEPETTTQPETSTDGPALTLPDSTADLGGDGSAQYPFPWGTVVASPDWLVTVNSVDLNANDKVLAASPDNKPAAAGNTYVLVNISASYIGTNPQGIPAFAMVQYVGPDGSNYYLSIAKAPDAFNYFTNISPGGVETGNVVLEVPSAVVDPGTIGLTAESGAPINHYVVK